MPPLLNEHHRSFYRYIVSRLTSWFCLIWSIRVQSPVLSCRYNYYQFCYFFTTAKLNESSFKSSSTKYVRVSFNRRGSRLSVDVLIVIIGQVLQPLEGEIPWSMAKIVIFYLFFYFAQQHVLFLFFRLPCIITVMYCYRIITSGLPQNVRRDGCVG